MKIKTLLLLTGFLLVSLLVYSQDSTSVDDSLKLEIAKAADSTIAEFTQIIKENKGNLPTSFNGWITLIVSFIGGVVAMIITRYAKVKKWLRIIFKNMSTEDTVWAISFFLAAGYELITNGFYNGILTVAVVQTAGMKFTALLIYNALVGLNIIKKKNESSEQSKPPVSLAGS